MDVFKLEIFVFRLKIQVVSSLQLLEDVMVLTSNNA